jgi:hypothetical protein
MRIPPSTSRTPVVHEQLIFVYLEEAAKANPLPAGRLLFMNS